MTLLSQTRRFVASAEIRNKIVLEIPELEHLVIDTPFLQSHRGAEFTHANMVRSLAQEAEELKYGHRDWRKKATVHHVFVVPATRIELLPYEVSTYPKVMIGDQEITLSTSGGSCPDAPGWWRDWLWPEAATIWNIGIKKLRAIAEAAVRGTSWEPYQFPREREDAFYAAHAQDWLAIAAWGDWEKGVPAGMVRVCASQGGRSRLNNWQIMGETRYFLVPREEYDNRTFAFVIDVNRHQPNAA